MQFKECTFLLHGAYEAVSIFCIILKSVARVLNTHHIMHSATIHRALFMSAYFTRSLINNSANEYVLNEGMLSI